MVTVGFVVVSESGYRIADTSNPAIAVGLEGRE